MTPQFFFLGHDLVGYYSFYDQVLVCYKYLAHREHLYDHMNTFIEDMIIGSHN